MTVFSRQVTKWEAQASGTGRQDREDRRTLKALMKDSFDGLSGMYLRMWFLNWDAVRHQYLVALGNVSRSKLTCEVNMQVSIEL